ncbi:hypothetical protein AAC387_Pa10g1079 [Persea americana]|eukprot:TRINITY_DN13989_c0_g1_i1.p1 TRINITY_DN13989_c0_g1~~TRINITY_DN13989_c0_g1_i1.p1  ORF type:complete len:428 (+),score=67.27 TRINITY_DN13989_c0_g1_i1:43-1326(+)
MALEAQLCTIFSLSLPNTQPPTQTLLHARHLHNLSVAFERRISLQIAGASMSLPYTISSHAASTQVCKPRHRFLPSATARPSTFGSGCGIIRRNLLLNGVVAAAGVSINGSSSLGADYPVPGMERLPFKPDGYNFWKWRGHNIHYVEQGKGIPVVLIHGFGASAFHWRYNLPELAKMYKVYAIDLLGFGWSDKAIIEYDTMIWKDQVTDFLKEVVKEPAILVGNSLGGFTALVTAAELHDQVLGVALLNSAGQFGTPSEEVNNDVEETTLQKFLWKPLKEVIQRTVLGFVFLQAKQPARIESVLKRVYINTKNVDDYLVESIRRPAADPNAGEVYYRLMTRFMLNQTKYTLDSFLSKLSCPLLLLWGDLDPWVGPTKAVRIKEFYPNTSLVSLQAGHCPHDEVPELVNGALINWLSSLKLEASLQTL